MRVWTVWCALQFGGWFFSCSKTECVFHKDGVVSEGFVFMNFWTDYPISIYSVIAIFLMTLMNQATD
jgi:hypothetical protein